MSEKQISPYQIPAVQKKWLQLIAKGIYYEAMVASPCSTFSRAVGAGDLGPYPLKSSARLKGVPMKQGRPLFQGRI